MKIDPVEVKPAHLCAFPRVVNGHFPYFRSRAVPLQQVKRPPSMFDVSVDVQPEVFDVYIFETIDISQRRQHASVKERGLRLGADAKRRDCCDPGLFFCHLDEPVCHASVVGRPRPFFFTASMSAPLALPNLSTISKWGLSSSVSSCKFSSSAAITSFGALAQI